ncbi:MAG TPA: hypothetical protein VJ942_07540 [Roseovarius sp.]|nr:hypothetical protein [Roseovarius sp.]
MPLDTHTITLSPEILEKLQAQVTFPDAAAINAFVADAINSYLQLGQLHQSGGQFQFVADGREDPVVLHFPFQPNPAQDAKG